MGGHRVELRRLEPVASLGAGASRTLTNRIDTNGLAVGEHTLTVEDDMVQPGRGDDEANNATTVTFTVTAPVQARPCGRKRFCALSAWLRANRSTFLPGQERGLATARFHYAESTWMGRSPSRITTTGNRSHRLEQAPAGRSPKHRHRRLAVGEHTLTTEETTGQRGGGRATRQNTPNGHFPRYGAGRGRATCGDSISRLPAWSGRIVRLFLPGQERRDRAARFLRRNQRGREVTRRITTPGTGGIPWTECQPTLTNSTTRDLAAAAHAHHRGGLWFHEVGESTRQTTPERSLSRRVR